MIHHRFWRLPVGQPTLQGERRGAHGVEPQESPLGAGGTGGWPAHGQCSTGPDMWDRAAVINSLKALTGKHFGNIMSTRTDSNTSGALRIHEKSPVAVF